MVTDLLARVIYVLMRFFKFEGIAPTSSDLIYKNGKASDAILYSLLYFPELEQIQDSIMLAWSVSDTQNRDRFLAQVSSNEVEIRKLEASFNFVEIGYLFETSGRNTNDEQDLVLAELIQLSWSQHLASSFHKRRFIVEILDPEVTGSTVGVHFFEDR